VSLMNVLGPNGRPMVSLGGADAWKQWVHGDIVVSLQWHDCGSHDGAEPCMVLFPSARRDAGAFVIPQASSWKYARNDGRPTDLMWHASRMVAVMLGFDANDRQVRMKLCEHIVDHMPDLKDMPSQPPREQQVKPVILGIEASMSVNGKTMTEEVI
jgi:hypothetical protein